MTSPAAAIASTMVALTVALSCAVPRTRAPDYSWECGSDRSALEAPADGSLSEWAPHYYVAHWWGDAGRAISVMRRGDTVEVNGERSVVERSFTMPCWVRYGEVMEEAGWGATVFQTCVPGTDLCLFVSARPHGGAAAAAAEAHAWAEATS